MWPVKEVTRHANGTIEKGPKDIGTFRGWFSFLGWEHLFFHDERWMCPLKAPCSGPPQGGRFRNMFHDHCDHGWDRPSTASVTTDLRSMHRACFWRCAGGQSCGIMAAFTQCQWQAKEARKMMLNMESPGDGWQGDIKWDCERWVTRRSPERCETSILSLLPRKPVPACDPQPAHLRLRVSIQGSSCCTVLGC